MADTTLPPLANDLRCAPQAVELGLDPRGTATRCSTLVLIEYGGLWPARIEDIDRIAALPPLPPDHRILATRGADEEAMPSLTVWRADEDLRFAGVDYEVMPGRLDEAIAALAGGGGPNEADGVTIIGPAPPEVLICGHGRRDTCCGNFGIRLLHQAEERAGQAWPGVRVRRCSHTGGHRFAPTGITLPEGRMWAFLDIDLLDAAVTGRPEPALVDANRGLMAIEPLAQRAEAALWAEHGPSWRSARPRVEDLSAPGVDETGVGRSYRFQWSGPPSANGRSGDGTGEATSATVVVRRSGAVPVPSCGAPMDEATKTSPTFEVLLIEHRSDQTG